MSSVAVIAALEREVKTLMHGWSVHRPAGGVVIYSNDAQSGDAFIVCAGMGEARAAKAVEAALAFRPVRVLLSAGIAGACDPKLRVGDVVRAGVVVDARSGERFANERFEQLLVSVDTVAGVTEKRRLFESYGASAVDMEAATVARLARAHGIEFAAVKAISDEAGFELAELGQFVTEEGQFRESAFAAWSAMRPRMWPKLIQLADNSKRAIEALTDEVRSQIDWYRQRG